MFCAGAGCGEAERSHVDSQPQAQQSGTEMQITMEEDSSIISLSPGRVASVEYEHCQPGRVTGLCTFSRLFVPIVFNVGHPCRGLIVL